MSEQRWITCSCVEQCEAIGRAVFDFRAKLKSAESRATAAEHKAAYESDLRAAKEAEADALHEKLAAAEQERDKLRDDVELLTNGQMHAVDQCEAAEAKLAAAERREAEKDARIAECPRCGADWVCASGCGTLAALASPSTPSLPPGPTPGEGEPDLMRTLHKALKPLTEPSTPSAPSAEGERRFPIQGAPGLPSIPWSLIAPHEKQAQANHYQTIERLAKRGGLSACEAVAVIEGRPWRLMTLVSAVNRLHQFVRDAQQPPSPVDPVAASEPNDPKP